MFLAVKLRAPSLPERVALMVVSAEYF